MSKKEPEDKATGGRMSFRAGKIVLEQIVS